MWNLSVKPGACRLWGYDWLEEIPEILRMSETISLLPGPLLWIKFMTTDSEHILKNVDHDQSNPGRLGMSLKKQYHVSSNSRTYPGWSIKSIVFFFFTFSIILQPSKWQSWVWVKYLSSCGDKAKWQWEFVVISTRLMELSERQNVLGYLENSSLSSWLIRKPKTPCVNSLISQKDVYPLPAKKVCQHTLTFFCSSAPSKQNM